MYKFSPGVYLAYITGGRSEFENMPQVTKYIRAFIV